MSPAPRTSPIRVLHLRDTRRVCGPGKTICETARLNGDADVEYEVAAFGRAEGNDFLARASAFCPTFSLPESRTLLPSAAVRLARRLRAGELDLLHAHDLKSDFVSLLAARFGGAPCVTTVHGYIAITGKSRLYREMDRALLRGMDRVIVVSEAMRKDLAARGIRPGRLRVVRNCIALDAYPFGSRGAEAKAPWGIPPESPVVGHVGRLSAEKGQARLLRAFPRILESVPSARLVFAGDGPDAGRLRELARALGVEAEARFLGYRPDIREVFRGLDVLALSSDTEGLPNVVLEAMALGVPVVATAVGGTPEAVEHGVTGLLVDRGDERAIADAVIASLVEREAVSRRVRAARAFVEREFGMESLIRATHEMYRDLARTRA